jgi:hypothetical protein
LNVENQLLKKLGMRGLGKTYNTNRLGLKAWQTIKWFGLISFLLSLTQNISGQPNPVSVDSRSLYQHGTNSSGATTYENTDSVSLGSTTYYFYMPDTGTNPGFDKTYSNLWNGVTDAYTWTVTPAIAPAGATSVATHPTAAHYKQITWSGSTGTGIIEVKIKTPANCENTYTAPIEVISLPTVQYIITDSSFCITSGNDGSLGYTLTNLRVGFSTVVKGNKSLKVNITIACTNSGFGTVKTYNNITLTQTGTGTAVFNLPLSLNFLGKYTITLTAINDRISTKSGINGTVGASSMYNFVLSKVPAAIPLYHLKNE